MIKAVVDLFKYPFLQRAFVAGIAISVCVAILGVSLVLKRYSMVGDGLSHVGFSAFSVACALNWAPLFVCVPVVVFFAVFLFLLGENSKIKADALIALISNSCLAIGILIISLSTGMNNEVLNFMFGSILALKTVDLIFAVVFSLIAILFFVFFYNKIFSITFDEDFAKAVGVNVRIYKILIAVLTALIIVVGMKMVGALLISSLIIFPALSSGRVFSSYKKIVLFSAVNSIFAFVVGFFVSYVFSMPTGATVVVCNLILFLIYYFVGIARNIRFRIYK